MPVYNADKYLKEAIDSILNQTYTDFEFIIINDCSTDNSMDIIASYSDPRIILINNIKNIGVADTLNKGINLARGKYIVRMDADDISMLHRIERQVAFMEYNNDVGISGSWVETFNKNKVLHIRKTKVNNDDLKCQLLFFTPFAHSSVIIRTEIFNNYKLLYDPYFARCEDYDLWVKASEITALANINEVLLKYRIHPEQICQKNREEQDADTKKVRIKLLKKIGIHPNNSEIELHDLISLHMRFDKVSQAEVGRLWLEKLVNVNSKTKYFPTDAFNRNISEIWFRCCYNSCQFGLWVYKYYSISFLSKLQFFNYKDYIKFAMRCWLKYSK